MDKINKESIQDLAVIISDIMSAVPPKLDELELCGLGGSVEQG